jgi:hypothetical protein
MPNVKHLETALRCLFVSALFAAVSNVMPAHAQYANGSGNVDLTNADAPLFTQPNHYQDLRQHTFFAGDYRNAATISVGYNNQPLFYYDDPIIQTVVSGPTPVPYNDVPNNSPVTTVSGSVPGLVDAAVTGAVIGASALGSSVGNVGSSIDSSGVSSSGTSQSVNGTVLDGASF